MKTVWSPKWPPIPTSLVLRVGKKVVGSPNPQSHGSLLTSSQHTVAAGLNSAPGSGFGLDELRSFEISKPMNALPSPSVKLRPL